MAVKHLPPKPPKQVISVGTDQAPFIYFDGVIAFAIHEGSRIAQIEFAANQLLAVADGDKTMVRPKIQTVAKVRCSEAALRNLSDVIDRLLDSFQAAREAEQASEAVKGNA